jgi:hypothetical protein
MDARTWLAQVAAKEEQVHVWLKMSRHELGELKKHWKADKYIIRKGRDR